MHTRNCTGSPTSATKKEYTASTTVQPQHDNHKPQQQHNNTQQARKAAQQHTIVGTAEIVFNTWQRVMQKIKCDREDDSFMAVRAFWRLEMAFSMTPIPSSIVRSWTFVRMSKTFVWGGAGKLKRNEKSRKEEACEGRKLVKEGRV
jgi:hypothetical protein